MTKPVNLRRHNLNALPVLREILRHQSLTAAARALNLTQPTLSNLLKQLRIDFEDELITREGQRMRLTPRGEQLLGPLERALGAVEELIAGAGFDPATSTAQINIGTTDHVMGVLGGPMLAILSDEAPDLRIRFHVARLSLIPEMMAGDIDLMIVPRTLVAAGPTDTATLDAVSNELLFQERLVALARADDAEVSAGLSRDRYLERPHIGYFSELRVHISVEQAHLAGLGLAQHDRLLATSYAIMPDLVAASNAIAVMPERLARIAMARLPLVMFDPPVPFPDMEWVMVWPKRNDRDARTLWLRETLKRAASGG